MSNNEKDFEVCMNVENVFLPSTGFFGVSAATGGLAGKWNIWLWMQNKSALFSFNHSGFYGNTTFFIADDHDVLKLSISSLRSPENAQVKNAAGDDADSKKIEEEFEQYQEKLKQQKADWEKEHPDQVRIMLYYLRFKIN